MSGAACRSHLVDGAPVIGTASVELHHMLAGYEWLADQGCDVIHDHTLAGPLYGPATTPTPVVTTNHGPFTSPDLASIYRAVQDQAAIVAISYDQARDASQQLIDIAAVIHHGLDTNAIPVGRGEGGYLLFLGRMAPEKGAHRAIAAARATGQRLIIAAKMREPAEFAYFRNEVAPASATAWSSSVRSRATTSGSSWVGPPHWSTRSPGRSPSAS